MAKIALADEVAPAKHVMQSESVGSNSYCVQRRCTGRDVQPHGIL